MAQRSGFFNALNVNGVYDRKYNANDYCDNLAVVIGNGVLRSTGDDLRVTANGLAVTVAAGRAWIDGHYYINDAPHSFTAVSAPIGGARWDRVVLRMNKDVSERSVRLVYVKGDESDTPAKPAPEDTDNVRDLVLADIYVGTNAQNVSVTDTRADKNLCGWVYSTSGDDSFFTSLDKSFNEWFDRTKDKLSSVTLFKRYNWRTVLQSASNRVQFSIPQWNRETSFIEVYVNGVLEHETVNYTIGDNSVLTFTNSLVAGTEIIVKVYKSIDGTGIESVAGEITELQNKVATLDKAIEYEYICTGESDNIAISKIAQDFLNGEGKFVGASAYAQMRLKVYGKCGVSAPYAGDGSTLNYNRWFALGQSTSTTRKLTVDFTCCERIEIAASGTVNMIIYGTDAHVIGLNVLATCYVAGGSIYAFMQSTGDITAEDCVFDIMTTGQANIGRSGTFTNCKGYVFSMDDNAYAFRMIGTVNEIRIFGGEYRCYAPTSKINAVVYSSATDTSAVCVMSGVKCPTHGVDGYAQTHALRVNAGYISCFGLISALANSTASAATAYINGTIPLDK